MFNFSDGQTAITQHDHVTIRSRDRTQALLQKSNLRPSHLLTLDNSTKL